DVRYEEPRRRAPGREAAPIADGLPATSMTDARPGVHRRTTARPRPLRAGRDSTAPGIPAVRRYTGEKPVASALVGLWDRSRARIPRSPTSAGRVVPDHALEPRPGGPRQSGCRCAHGPGRALRDLLVSALCLHPPEGIRPRRGPGPDPGVLRPAAGEGR